MKPSFTPWLPESALDSATPGESVRAAIQQWSGKWFPRDGPYLSGTLTRDACAGVPEIRRWEVLPEKIAVGVTERATGLLASAILDADLSGTTLLPKDRQLIEYLVESCLEDLRAVLAHLFGIVGSPEWQAETGAAPPLGDGGWTFRLCLEEREPLIQVAISRDLTVAFRRAIAPRPPVERRLLPLAEGLIKQRVCLSARLGQCEIALAELEALSQGDVLVLDRRLDQPLELAVDGQVKPGRCTIAEEGDRLLLKIATPSPGRGQ